MKLNLLIKHIIALCLALKILYGGAANATHTMGADLTYQCLGGNTYKITVSFYRDCIGIAAPANPYVTVSSASCGQSTGVTCYPRPGTGQEVTPICSSAVTTCNGGSFTGIQEWIYDGIITLPTNCIDWYFGYSLCCRNAAITTVNSPSITPLFIYATCNNLTGTGNSSPTFSNKPVPFLCLGQQFCFNHGAYDAEGDSIVYSLITPLQSPTANVSYISPYTQTDPLTSSPATSFSTTTGDICLTPQALEVTVMAVLVKEYRNGVYLGSVERDLQLTVMNCANNLPWLTGINGTNNFSMTICANQQTCFNIFSNDPDAGQHLTVDWNYGIPGATFTSSSALHPTGTLCWTPGPADIGNSYTFTATVSDDACPYKGSQTYAYTINVTGITVSAGPDQAIACSDLATLTAVAGGTGPFTYHWNTGSTMQSITVGAGTYVVTATNGTCSATDTVNVTTPYIPTAAFSNSAVTCMNSSVVFTDHSTTPGGMINYWGWTFGDGGTSFLQNPVHTFTGPGTYDVTLIIETTLGCRDTITKQIVIGAPPVSEFTWTSACVNSTVAFTDHTTGTPVSWNWTFGDGGSSTIQNPSHTFTAAGTYVVTLVSANASGCIDTVFHTVNVNPRPVANAGADQSVCSGGSVTLHATGGSAYVWNPGGQTTGTITITPGGSSTIVVSVTDTNGCSSTDSINVVVLPLQSINAGADQTICHGGPVTLTATGGNSYIWNPGGATTPSITINPVASVNYSVTGTGTNGCTSSDAVHISVMSAPVANAGPDVDICDEASTILTASGGGTYTWMPSGATNPVIAVNPSGTQTYIVTVTEAGGCTASDSVIVNVHPAPAINLTSFFLCSGSNATLNAGNAGSDYLWNTGDTTQTLSINAAGNYSVTVTDPYGCSASASCNVTSGTSMTINLTNVSFCQGDSVVLDAGYPGLSYAWTPGGQTSQTITVSNSGTYGVTVSDTSGCSGSISVTALKNPLPVADFSSVSACSGSAVNFTNGSSSGAGPITNWNWSFNDGSNSNTQNPSHTFSNTSPYSATLIVTTSDGCSSSVTHAVNINPLPVTGFNFSNSCEGASVHFTDTSSVASGNISGYQWDFGDGINSSSHNPSHTFASAGNYSVTLNVTTDGGCTGQSVHTITVNPLPVALFSADSVCLGLSTTFSNNSTIATGSISGVSWDFGDASLSTLNSPSHIYSSAGNHTVRLISTSSFGCTDTISQIVFVKALPVANAGADQSFCAGDSAHLTATGGNSYLWMPVNKTTPSIYVHPLSNKVYSVIVTSANGCTATDTVKVFRNVLPVANAGADNSVCAGSNITLHGTGGVTFNWMPGNISTPNATVNPAAYTNYILTVTDGNGCKAKDTVSIGVNPLPVVSAGPDPSICAGSTTSLTATGASSYLWNPVGMTTSTILVTPISSSTYIVSGTDINGCASSDTVNVNVNAVPVFSFSPSFICEGTSTTLDAGNPGSTFAWSTTETTQSIIVSDSGTYSVLVTNTNGCPAAGTVQVTKGAGINSAPVTHNVCAGNAVVLDAGNAGSRYHWSTGVTSQTISVTTAGNYSVVITDGNDCSATINHVVNVNNVPVAAFTAPSVCDGSPLAFNNNSTGGIITSLWNFGDMTSSSANNPQHSYPASGTYTTTLTVTTSQGCVSTASSPVVVYPVPVADFSSTVACLNSPSLFNNSSAVSTGTISSYSWNFGDGNTSAQSSPVHPFASAGNYNVTLIAVSANGCSDTASNSVTILQTPDANFVTGNICLNNNLLVNNTSSSSAGTIASYAWTFGDGSTDTSSNPSHNYSTAGNYIIKLTVISVNGCSDSATANVQVYPLPHAQFSAGNVCEGSAVSINNQSSVSSGTIQNNYWRFGDNSSSTQVNPSHLYNTSGIFNSTLIVTTANGCSDTISSNIIVNPHPQSSFVGTDVCQGNYNSFTNTSSVQSGTISSYTYDFMDGTASALANPVHYYNAPGSYDVALTATSDLGCSYTSTYTVNVYPEPAAGFTTSDVCYGNQTQFVNQSNLGGGGSYMSAWTFSDGDSSSLINPAHRFNFAGSYNATLQITSSHGCIADISHPISVYNLPEARFSAPDNCQGSITQFSNQSSSTDGNINVSLWNFGDGSSSFETNPGHTYSDSGDFNVDLLAISSYGCLGRFADTVSVMTVPSPSIVAQNNCVGVPVQISANVTNAVSYDWSVGNNTAGNSQNFSQTFNASGTYSLNVRVTSALGCSGTDNVLLKIYPAPVAEFSSTEVCQSGTTVFNNHSMIHTGNLSSYAWDFGDNGTSPQYNTTHVYSAPGNYNAILSVTSDHGCIAAISQQVVVHPNPTVSFNAGAEGCSPVKANFLQQSNVAGGNISGWLWNFGDGTISTDQSPLHTYDHSGTYSVTVTVVSDIGCTASFSQNNIIRVLPGPTADFTADPLITDMQAPFVHFYNQSENFSTYQWIFGDGSFTSTELNPTHTFQDTGTYSAMLITVNNNGCRDTIMKRIEVKNHSTLFVPNCFTPNEDGENDLFKPEYTQMKDIQVWVYDRWGKLLKNWDTLEGSWDGYYKGRKCQEDTYVYKIIGTGLDGKNSEWVGHVSIVY